MQERLKLPKILFQIKQNIQSLLEEKLSMKKKPTPIIIDPFLKILIRPIDWAFKASVKYL